MDSNNNPLPPTPPKIPNPPEKPEKSYFQRNLVGNIGAALAVLSFLLVFMHGDDAPLLSILNNLWLPVMIAACVMCAIGLFRKPRLIPALGCLALLFWILFLAMIAIAAGQWKAPTRPLDEIDSLLVQPADTIEIDTTKTR